MIPIDVVVEDLERFKDPATEVTRKISVAGAEIHIIRDGESRVYIYDAVSGKLERRDSRRRSFVSLKSLLASNEFADLAAFADTQRRVLSQRNENYLEPAGIVDEGSSTEQIPLRMDSFLSLAAPSKGSQLHCILIDGPAGVGKTTLIERLVLARAQQPANVPILHVTSRGRRLTNLRDAFAGTTTAFRAKFVPDEIPVLVRHGLIQVALDGFDEFVDPSGYQDAWGALKDFLRDCGTSGPIILAGRDTFFDQQNFQRQLATMGQNVRIVTVRLTEVSPEAAKEWLRRNGWSDAELNSTESRNYLRRGSYILRPFFLSRIRPLQGWAALQESRKSPQTFIIDEMVNREATLLSEPLALPATKIYCALEALFEQIAEDMAERETDNVPLHYLAFVAEYAFHEILPEQQMSRLRHSLGSIALIEPGEPGATVKFPHTEIQNRFLARALIENLAADRPAPLLGRVIFGMDRVEAFAERLTEIDTRKARETVKRLRHILDGELQSVRLSLNLSALLMSSLSREDAFEDALVMQNVDANDVRIEQSAGAAHFSNVTIARLDVRNADLAAVT